MATDGNRNEKLDKKKNISVSRSNNKLLKENSTV
jgi:hypothetical protein